MLITEPGKIKIDDLRIYGPGEYEKNRIFVQAIKGGIHWISIDSIILFFVGLGKKIKNKDLVDIDNIDILLAFHPEQPLINLIEPRLVIPLNKLEIGEKIKLSKKNLPDKGNTIIWESKKS